MIKGIVKKAVACTMLTVTLGTAVLSAVPSVQASYYTQLGTNAALGSPVLNNNFTTDDWNKWEMVCWGVFLSNFCVPLVDNYKTAFTSGNGGSQGAGFGALSFGTGSDPVNDETIQELCNYAVQQQESASKSPIYVTYNIVGIDTGQTAKNTILYSVDPNSASAGSNCIRLATFDDMWMTDTKDNASTKQKNALSGSVNSGTVVMDVDDLKDLIENNVDEATTQVYAHEAALSSVSSNITTTSTIPGEKYKSVAVEGLVPTFWIQSKSTTGGSKYVKILDYSDAWDVQIPTLMMSKVVSSDMKDEFISAFNADYEANEAIRFDIFGNIVTNTGLMIIPGSTNPHLTETNKINLVNSYIMNGASQVYSSSKLVENIKQYTDWGGVGMLNTNTKVNGSAPALASNKSSIKAGSTYLYYDIDSVVMSTDKTYGDALLELVDNSDINAKSQKYNLKVESVNAMKDSFWFGIGQASNSSGVEAFVENQIASSAISSNINKSTKTEMLTQIELLNGTQLDLFDSDPVMIPVQVLTEDESEKGAATRHAWDFLFQALRGKIKETTSGTINTTDLRNNISSAEGGAAVGKVFENNKQLYNAFKEQYNVKSNVNALFDWGGNNTFNDTSSRVIVLYPTSKTFKAVADILGIGTSKTYTGADSAMSAYSSYIYLTYLKFYGISGRNKINGAVEQKSDFNEELFDPSSDILNYDPSATIETLSPEDMEKQVLNYSYLLLSPTSGRSYRSQLIATGLSDWIYDQYTRITFGGTKTSSSIASKSNSGFLHVATYSENFLTKSFIEYYSTAAIWIMMIMLLIMVPVGLLKRNKASWFLLTAVTIVNTILLVPSMGEIVPYVTQNMVQKMFSSKMTYWAIAEAISNSSAEADLAEQNGIANGMTSDEASQVNYLVKQLNVVYLDRSLMVKRDISAKVTQKVTNIYTDVQSMQSVRWLLPMIMRQYSAEDKSANYVYQSLGDLYDNMSNIYWYYNPTDATAMNDVKPTSTSGQTAQSLSDSVASQLLTSNIPNVYPNFKNIDNADDLGQYEYQSYSYSSKNNNEYHKMFFYLDGVQKDGAGTSGDRTLSVRNRTGIEVKDFDKWATEYSNITVANQNGEKAKAEELSKIIESIADQYDSSDRESIDPLYGYLWNTETPAYYFYFLVKDTAQTLDTGSAFSAMIAEIQGKYSEDANGKEVRDNFMYAKDKDDKATGYLRDVLDLQYLFTNMVPYMYETMLTTGGTDGKDGLLKDEVISDDLTTYAGMDRSWLYRSNWIVKLMECPDYSKPLKVRDKDGKSYTVDNPLLYECYPEGRPMVCSEAQMKDLGLKEDDLNIVELKCIEANKQVAKSWTLLLNYAGTSGMTLEILERQMAMDATMIFSRVFSPTGITNNSYIMYPQSLDLRNISFDSVMRMLMLNVSNDTSYIYNGNTMQTLIEDTDIWTAALLLLIAVICAYLIPFVRMVLMAAIFYLGYAALLKAIFADSRYKMKTACGQLISNLIVLGMTIGYYLVFYLMLSITSSDEVLSINRMKVTSGNPMWCLVIILIASCAYVYGMWAMINFCFKNYRDMGMEIYASVIGGATAKIKGAIRNIKADISGSGSNSGSGTGNRPRKDSSDIEEESKRSGGANTTEEVEETDTKSKKSRKKKQDVYSSEDKDFEGNYIDTKTSAERDTMVEKDIAENIDDKIKEGKTSNSVDSTNNKDSKDTNKN